MSEEVLRLRVLDKLAEELAFESWNLLCMNYAKNDKHELYEAIERAVDLALEEAGKEIEKEWNTHKNNFDKSGDWFECNATKTLFLEE